MSIESVIPSNHLIFCHPLFLLPSIFPSTKVFSNESDVCLRWPSIGASASVLPVNIQGWLPLGFTVLAVQGTPKSFLQHHSSKESILWCSVFFMVQLSHSYMTTGKNRASDRWNFDGKVTSLNFNMLSRLVIAFLPRSKHLLISWLQSSSAVILETKKIKSVTVFIVSPSICHKVLRPDAMILDFWILSFKPDSSLSSFNFVKRLFSS